MADEVARDTMEDLYITAPPAARPSATTTRRRF